MNKRLIILSVILVAFAGYLYADPFHASVPLKKPFSSFPLRLNGWKGKDQQFNDEVLEKLKVSEYMLRDYVWGQQRVELYVGYYKAQKEGAQIHSPNHCLPGGGWQNIAERTRRMVIDGVGPVDFVEAVYRKGDEKEVLIYLYKMKNAYITGDYSLKWCMIRNCLMYGRNDAAFVRLSAPVSGSVEETIKTMEAYMRDLMPILKNYLPE
jgi:EpsI family protein